MPYKNLFKKEKKEKKKKKKGLHRSKPYKQMLLGWGEISVDVWEEAVHLHWNTENKNNK